MCRRSARNLVTSVIIQVTTWIESPFLIASPTSRQTWSQVKKMSKFETVTDKVSFSAEEENILAYWQEIDAFNTSLKLSEGRPEYTFYDGPPFATGLPHYG